MKREANRVCCARTAIGERRTKTAMLNKMTGSTISGARFLSWRHIAQSDAASAARARGSLADQFQTGAIERRDQLHQRIDITPDHTVACLHALHSRDRQPAALGQLMLIDPKQGTCRTQLGSCDHPLRQESRTIANSCI